MYLLNFIKLLNLRDCLKITKSNIATYSWNFGSGATPSSASAPGLHTVVYASIGTYKAILTGTSGNPFTSNACNNNDQVSVILTSNAACIAMPKDTSNIITISVANKCGQYSDATTIAADTYICELFAPNVMPITLFNACPSLATLLIYDR